MSSLTDSAVRSGETGGALAPEPVDSVHADPTIVTEGAKKLTVRWGRTSFPATTKHIDCVPLWGGGHKTQFNPSIQASTFQMLIGVSSSSPPLIRPSSIPPQKPSFPPRSHGKNGHVHPLCHSTPHLHSPQGRWDSCPPHKTPTSHCPIQYLSPLLCEMPFEAWFKDNFHCFSGPSPL